MASRNDYESSFRGVKSKKPQQFSLANKYFKFLGKRTKLSEKERYNISF